MNEQQTKLLEKLADKLGVTVEHLWSVLVRQAPIEAITGCFVTVSILTVSIFALNRVNGLKTDDYGDIQIYGKDTAIPKALLVVICMAFIAVGLLSASFDICAITTALFNPEYYAFKQIIK